jgi:hypothetical protein
MITLVNKTVFNNPSNLASGSFSVPATTPGNVLVIAEIRGGQSAHPTVYSGGLGAGGAEVSAGINSGLVWNSISWEYFGTIYLFPVLSSTSSITFNNTAIGSGGVPVSCVVYELSGPNIMAVATQSGFSGSTSTSFTGPSLTNPFGPDSTFYIELGFTGSGTFSHTSGQLNSISPGSWNNTSLLGIQNNVQFGITVSFNAYAAEQIVSASSITGPTFGWSPSDILGCVAVAFDSQSSASFTLSAAPANPVLVQGQTGELLVTVIGAGGFSGAVTLSVSGLPSGVTGTFSPNPATNTSSLKLVASNTAALGTVNNIDIHGVSGSLNADVDFNLTIVSKALPPPLAAYFRYDAWASNPVGPAVIGGQVFVCSQPVQSSPTTLANGNPSPLATTYADPLGASALIQPVITDGFGHADFYVAAGTYTVLVYWSGVLQLVLPDQVIGASGVGSIQFETNGFLNTSQSVENLIAGLNISLTADSFGGTTIASTLPLLTDGTPNADQTVEDLLSGTNIHLTNSSAGTSINTSFGLLQTKRVNYVVTLADLTRGYLIIPVLWTTIFADVNYTVKYSVQSPNASHLSCFEASIQSITTGGFTAVVWGITNTIVVGSTITIHATGVHD